MVTELLDDSIQGALEGSVQGAVKRVLWVSMIGSPLKGIMEFYDRVPFEGYYGLLGYGPFKRLL